MTRYDDDGTRIYFRQRFVIFTPEDEDAFSRILRTEFPSLIFCNIDARHRRVDRHPSLAACNNYVHAWLPEPGWTPRFGVGRKEDNPQRIVHLLNTPSQGFFVYKSVFVTRNLAIAANPKLKPPDRTIRIPDGLGQVQGYYRVDDPNNKAFLDKVMRLIAAISTNCFEWVDLKTGESVETLQHCTLWAGPDAAHRSRAEPDFFCFFDYSSQLGRWLGARALPKSTRSRRRKSV